MSKFLLILLVVLVGCSSENEPPEGYIDECYGGDWQQNMVGINPTYSVVLDIEKKDWPKLTALFKRFSNEHGLKYFDGSEETSALSMVYISACSNNGLWLHADKRIWSFDGQKDHSPLPLMVSVHIYSNVQNWKHIPKAIDSMLKNTWPNSVNSEHGYKSTLHNSLL
jgi:hypothetical protein